MTEVNEEIKKISSSSNDPLISLSTLMVILTLFYSLLFQLFDLNIDTQEFGKQLLFFTLLLITFLITILIFLMSQKPRNSSIEKTIGFFIFIFWWVVYLYFNKKVLGMVGFFSISFNQLIESSISFGLAWLIIIPAFILPFVGVIITSKLFGTLNTKIKRRMYYFIALLISILFFLAIKTKIIIRLIMEVINLIQLLWLQLLFFGISIGCLTMLIVAPIYPLIFEVIRWIIHFFQKYISGTNLLIPKTQLPQPNNL